MDEMVNGTFEMEYLDGKVRAFGISKVTKENVIKIIGEKLNRPGGAMAYVLDDFQSEKML